MGFEGDNRKKSVKKSNRLKDIFNFYIFTVVLIGVADAIIFSFSIKNFLISTSIVSAIFICVIIAGNQKQKVKKSIYSESADIKLYQPKIIRDEPGLIELKRKNLNFKLAEFKEETAEIQATKKGTANLEKASDDKEKELKKFFNPYRSPFEPINPVTKEDNTTYKETTEINPAEETEEEVSAASETLPIDGDLDNEINNETDNVVDSEDEEELYEDYSIETEIKSVASPNVSYCIDNDEDSSEIADIPGEVINILKFRPRSVNQNTEEKEEEQLKNTEKGYIIDEPYVTPPFDLLRKEEKREEFNYQMEEQEIVSNKLIETLASFGVGAKVIDVSKGPTVTRYELQPNPGVKVSKIVGLSDDIALNLAATGVRIEAPIPGKAAVGIEVPNKEIKPVLFSEVIKSPEFSNHPSKLAFALGKDVAGRTIVGDIAKMPHLLIAGATGSGKSVCINTLIASILYKASPSEVKLLLVDPKVVELGIYNGVPHLLIPVVTDPKKAAGALNWAVVEMTNRYKLFAENNVRDIKGYNAQMKAKNEPVLPQVVIIIDELADLMMVAPNDVEDCICRLAQMARAAGMHLVIATQRPSVDVITGVIKANIPSRISFAVSSQIDSRTILDMAGAEKLLGRGDMLFNPIGEMKPTRVQGSFISDKEVEALVTYLKDRHKVYYDQEVLDKINEKEQPAVNNDTSDDDELLPQVIEMVIEHGQASASLIQRKFKVGYSRAARILDQMESWGIVGPADGSKPRQILVTKQEWDELNS